ncbi:hypothetical protein ACRRVB_02330 [Candidatus Cardinium hertigii]|uniref:hypothetical protein n=1 Tax=Candidatus Cardinium hertigii TaxID=247481 RepID=UPI003D7CFED8
MSISICKWLYIRAVFFLMGFLAPCSQAIAYTYDRVFFGVRGAISGLNLSGVKRYAVSHGYNNVEKFFCDFDLEGALYTEKRIWNHIGLRFELGPRYAYTSFTGEKGINKIKKSIGLHCYGGHISCLTYFYPCGRFADNRSWNGQIGLRFSTVTSKSMLAHVENTENGKPFDNAFMYCILGIGLESISGLQLDCRYYFDWLSMHDTDAIVPYRSSLDNTSSRNRLHALSLGIGYRFL